tara:strand:- start:455 stop:1795 length:1341 start_codon:yes stop_codon:yes gene_type:complete
MITDKYFFPQFQFLLDNKNFELNQSSKSVSWIDNVRKRSLEIFNRYGLPSKKLEDWKYTDLRSLSEIPFSLADISKNIDLQNSIDSYETTDGYKMVFVNGYFDYSLSKIDNLPKGVYLSNLSKTLKSNPSIIRESIEKNFQSNTNLLSYLNFAFMKDGYVLTIAENVVVEKPIEFIFLSVSNDNPESIHPRSIVIANKGSSVKINEIHNSLTDNYFWSNPVTSFFLGENSSIFYHKIQQGSNKSFHLSNIDINLDSNAYYESFILTNGDKISQNSFTSNLNGPGSQSFFCGAQLNTNEQHSDIKTLVNHNNSKCKSFQKYYSVADNKSHAVFQGKIFVKKNSQQTNADQLCRGLLLSSNAEITNKPELEILADDVQCTHGASIGDLDDDHLFYLRSRGIKLEDAKKILIESFFQDIVSSISNSELRSRYQNIVSKWINKNITENEK